MLVVFYFFYFKKVGGVAWIYTEVRERERREISAWLNRETRDESMIRCWT